MKEKLFTKSAFKIALECPRKLYYYRNPDVYANADVEDEFLQALAEGGFQVGELAKIYCEVPPENDIKEKDYKGSLARTQELLKQQQVNIAEAAFRYGNLFVRVDILKRDGHVIDLNEVKAKSWEPNEDSFVDTKGCVRSCIRSYVYDVAFQKYVVTQALKELYPGETFKVRARLMMADKSKTADINGLNQMFKIKKVGNQAKVERADDIDQVLAQSHVKVLTAFDVDGLCDRVIAGKTTEQGKDGFMLNMKFLNYVTAMSKYYCNNEQFPDITLGTECFKCQFYSDGNDGKRDGYRECWKAAAHFNDIDFDEPLVRDLWGAYIRRGEWLQQGVYKMADITEDLLPRHTNKPSQGLDHLERKWLQIAMATSNKDLLAGYASDILDCGAYLDIDGLRQEMTKWQFPLHMIDFETTAVALPFYVGMRPYEQVAFQFSHHIIEQTADGDYTIRHAGQYLNNDVSQFPNFEFVRALREQLGHDEGTIFRYSPHENTILNAIRRQLDESNENDKDELIAFIDEITHDSKAKRKGGPRDMIDLWEVVKLYFYEPREMGGSNSIKVVLPAVLNISQFLKDKYSKRIYGKKIPSQNIPSSDPIAWIEIDSATGHVENPYHKLPSVSEILKLDGITDDILEREDDDMTIANGGAALTAYNKLMFSDSDAVQTKALRKAMLRYCELDTMAMVFIWEYFNHECLTKSIQVMAKKKTDHRRKSKQLFGLNYPSADKIASRTSTVARAMASTLAPIVEVNELDEDTKSRLTANEVVRCVYCGCIGSNGNKLQLDHLYSLVGEKGPSGYYTEPLNLVPCCSACNGSKGSKQWDDYMDIKSYIDNNSLHDILTSSQEDNTKQLIGNYLKDNSCNFEDILEIYYNYIRTKSKEQRNGKQNTFFRLYQNGGLNGVVDSNGNYQEGFEGLEERRNRLKEYCNKYNLPYKDKKECSNNQEEHKIDFDNEVLEWWRGLYSSIKLSLETAQIQLDAFKAGIRAAIKENNNVNIDDVFKSYIEEIKKLNIKRSQSKRILVEAGIIKDDNDLDITFNKDYADAIERDAKNAIKKGVEYACRNNDQKSLLKKLYS